MGRAFCYLILLRHLFCQHVPKKRRYPNRDAVFLSFGGATPTSDWALHAEGVANPVRGYSGRKHPEIPGVFFSSSTDEKNGYATVAMTKYYDGTEEPALPINLGTHSIYFYAE